MSTDAEITWQTLRTPRGFQTRVERTLYEGGGGDIEAVRVGPRGGRSTLYRTYLTSPAAREQALRTIRRERELLDAYEAAIRSVPERSRS